MRNRLRERGYRAGSAGLLNTPAHVMDQLMIQAGTVIICNKPNVEERFEPERLHHIEEFNQEAKDIIMRVVDKHKARGNVVTCETIGRDKWAKENHPELVGICDAWLTKIWASSRGYRHRGF